MDHSDAFDYWGKGTQVTVEGKEMPLSIFPVTECPSGNPFQIGCMSTGLQRDLPFEWFDSNNVKLTSGVVQFPATLRDEAYAKMSFITVKKEDFNNDNYFKCKVGNGSATIPETKTPTVNLVKVSEGESVMCVAENFFPKDFTIKLKEDGLEASSQDWPATRKSPALYSAGSLLKVNKTLWDKNVKYSCEIKHGTEVITKTRSFTGTFTVTIHRPVAKDLFIYKKAKIQCDITGGNKMEVEGAQLSWKFQGKPVNATHITSDEVKQTEELYIKTSTLTLDDSDWFSGAEVECFTKRDQDTISKKASIKHGDESCSVQIYTPNDNVPSVEKIPLVCQVNSSSLGDVYIMWKKSDGSFVEGTITAADSGGKFVFSFLTVTSEEYNNVITCAVKHANMKNLNSPKMATASKKEPSAPDGLYVNCDKDSSGEDDYNSLWSTASSFIFLFLFTIIYSTVLSLSKMK
uniref:Immunoglobulin heavy constant zeta n=1 Tax=Astyanax mexicanus TaxID=7994 RepID=W5L190_ASTMX